MSLSRLSDLLMTEHLLYMLYVVVSVCSEAYGSPQGEMPHAQMGVGSWILPGNLDGLMVKMQAWNIYLLEFYVRAWNGISVSLKPH